MSLLSSAKWNALSQFFKIFIQLINMVYLATIIPPEEYGIMAMAAVVINLGVLLRDLGTASAIIQRKTLPDVLVNSIFWLNVCLGIGLCIVIAATSPIIAHVYEQPELNRVLLFLSLTFPLSSCAAVHLALLERDSKFKIVSLIEVSSSLFSVIVAVILANLGFGVYSLVIQSIIMNLTSAILFWKVSGWKPKWPTFSMWSHLRDIFSFSANVSVFNIINYFSRNADSFIIGKYMSAFILGNYNLAYRIMLFPLASLTFVFGRSLYPIMSRHQDDIEYIKKIYLDCVFYILMLSAPLMSGVAILSEPLINIVFGSQWSLTASILVWLAPTAILQSVISTTGSVFSSKNRTGLLLLMGVIGSTLMVVAFLIGVHYDAVTFAKLYLIANVINFFPPVCISLWLLNSNLFELVKKIFPIIISTIIMILLLEFLLSLKVIKLTGFLELVAYAAFGSCVYFIALFAFSKKIRSFIFGKIKTAESVK
ncbi:lipopolysaccharide biosynthesis protein [Klebsiella aerogenes]|uniref:lipopolysaccharide biosynthesis protein n=1 Tax=Klebsiella aerogenes TaxID=548 RepID=UPI001867FA75|nr:lipopolysaccharide biosynthesis protein [Klebsiella aerogenes]MDG0005264.1 lipopolysaccharide biosynthesis protein [Klebsiella aerogenes]HEP1062505.1 lipopolysaccharide biosynthesis protein [Klebsiella aerogenes]